jgi:hypothetical protein
VNGDDLRVSGSAPHARLGDLPAGSEPGPDESGRIELGNEFAQVVVERVHTRNGVRLRIFVPSSGRQISLCPLELEALTWADPDLFARLLATPHGPEDGAGAGASQDRG